MFAGPLPRGNCVCVPLLPRGIENTRFFLLRVETIAIGGGRIVMFNPVFGNVGWVLWAPAGYLLPPIAPDAKS
jgi:hypothetical protein